MKTPDTKFVEELTGGRYRVERLLATGGMGAVFLARHVELNSRVAIKTLPEEIALNSNHLARFKREAALAAGLSHPNIVPVFEYSADRTVPFLIMPFIEGRTLKEVVETDGPLERDTFLRLIREIGSALGYAHEHGIVHRDVKPANILLENETERWLITDFGIARDHVKDSEITASGAAIGTPAYMAPEQFGDAGRVDGRADLYAMAVVAVEALTGTRPDTLLTTAETLSSVRQSRADLTERAVTALTAGLAHAPGDRPDTIGTWVASVEKAFGARRGRRQLAALAAGVAALAGLMFFKPAPEAADSERTVAVFPIAVTGSSDRLDVSAVVPLALEWHMQRLPGIRVTGTGAVSDAQVRRFGAQTPPLSERLSLVAGMGAERAVETWADISARGDSVALRMVVHNVAGGGDPEAVSGNGSLNDLDSLVAVLVVQSFATSIAAQETGVRTAALPHGIEAIREYFLGDRAFRHADYADAINRFDRVIELDSTYALAHFKRMLAVANAARPLEVSSGLRSAVAAVHAYSDRLDPAYSGLLDGYRILFDEGNVETARRRIRTVLDDYPDLVDARFVLAFVEYRLGPLIGIPVAQARQSFFRVLEIDPEFAAAEASLALIAIGQGDRAEARRHVDRYLQIDSTSEWSDLARAADSLVFRQSLAPAVIRSLPSRSDRFLELLAVAGAEPDPPGGGRAIAEEAARELWGRPASDEMRAVRFRVLMSYYLGAARHETASQFFREATSVPADERDRWAVLTGITDLPDLADSSETAVAAVRLVGYPGTASDSARNEWIAARWFALTGGGARYDSMLRTLRTRAAAPGHPLSRSLSLDLEAREAIAAGDTTTAMERWNSALKTFAVDRVLAGIVASLWPVRVDYARTALANGTPRLALDVTEPFNSAVSLMDQLAWYDATMVRARAAIELRDRDEAVRVYARLLRTVTRPDGTGSIIREDLQRALDELRQPD